jgi:hypothetical protein
MENFMTYTEGFTPLSLDPQILPAASPVAPPQNITIGEQDFRIKKRTGSLFTDERSDQSKKPKLQAKPPALPPTKPYWEKKPYIFNDQFITNDTSNVVINGNTYPLKLLGSGKYHQVYRFTNESDKFTIDERIVVLAGYILKILNTGTIGPKKGEIQRLMENDVKAYELLKARGVPLPECLVSPKNFTDTLDKNNGGFWLLEKMEEKADCNAWSNPEITFEKLEKKQQDLLIFVKKFLTQSDELQCEIINDFFPRNLMYGKEEWCLIDFSLGESDEWKDKADPWKEDLFKYVWAWSNQNPNIFEYLISDFKNTKSYIQKCMAEKQKENGGKIPAYSNTKV